MAKIKTNELIDQALDWAVNQIEECCDDPRAPAFSTNWSQGGPIIEREMLTVGPAKHQGYMAWAWPKEQGFWGDTPLIAAMRCYVASKLGDEIEIPEELQ